MWKLLEKLSETTKLSRFSTTSYSVFNLGSSSSTTVNSISLSTTLIFVFIREAQSHAIHSKGGIPKVTFQSGLHLLLRHPGVGCSHHKRSLLVGGGQDIFSLGLVQGEIGYLPGWADVPALVFNCDQRCSDIPPEKSRGFPRRSIK